MLGIDNGETCRVEVDRSEILSMAFGEPVPVEPDPPLTYDPHRLADMSKAKPLPFYHGRRRY